MAERTEAGGRSLAGRGLICALMLSAFYAVGSVAFVSVERENELLTYEMNRVLYHDMKRMYEFDHCADPSFAKLGFCKDQQEFSNVLEDFFNEHGNSVADGEKWTHLGAIFFLTQLSATIGYGNTACATPLGQALTVVFLVIGIPLMGYVIFTMALLNMALCGSVAAKFGAPQRQVHVLAVLFGAFLLLGALGYHFLEGWSYIEALYFSFTTLTTIGLGDYLPSTRTSKVFSIFYIIFGLGQGASLIGLLAVNVERTHLGVDAFLRSGWKTLRDRVG